MTKNVLKIFFQKKKKKIRQSYFQENKTFVFEIFP